MAPTLTSLITWFRTLLSVLLRIRMAGLVIALAALALPAAGAAAQLQPLVDLPPSRPLGDRDRVLTGDARTATASLAFRYRAYRTAAGETVRVSLSDSYAESESLAQTYVDFLGSLEHGAELSRLKVHIAPAAEVTQECGGVEGTLACYDARNELMVVPGRQVAADGVTTSYVVAHEYGHHIARNRSNLPWSALDYGPKYWASYERVCDHTLDGDLAPGDEGENYRFNPGESWAETYAQLRYPDVRWTFTDLLEPDAGAFAAARKDVVSPWNVRKVKKLSGTFTASGPDAVTRSFTLRLDGPISFTLKGPAGTQYDMSVASDDGNQGSTNRAGSRDVLRYKAACRTSASELVRVTVRRRSGNGDFTVTVKYAG